MGLVNKVVTGELLSFVGGALVAPGQLVTVDDTHLTEENSPNLATPGAGYAAQEVVPIAAIGPTGPNPTMPQQIAPGSFATTAGYIAPGGGLQVAEGSVAAVQASTAAADTKVEEDAPVRRQAAEPPAEGTPEAVIDGSIADVTPRLATLDAGQLDAVRAAEVAGKNRTGVLNAVDEAKEKLATA